MSSYPKYMPLSRLVSQLPGDLGTTGALNEIAIVGFLPRSTGDGLAASVQVALLSDELELSIGGLDGVVIVLPGSGETPITLTAVYGSEFSLTASNLTAILRFRSGLFRAASDASGEWEATDGPVDIDILLGSVSVDSEFRPTVELSGEITIPPLMIGQTGIVIEATGLRLYVSGNETPPEGRDPGFRGVAFEGITVHLPSAFQLGDLSALTATGLVVGTGGVSGTFAGVWEVSWNEDGTAEGEGGGTLAGFAFALEKVSLTLVQNTVTGGSIRGQLRVPWLESVLVVDVVILADGGLSITVAAGPDDPLDSENDGSGYIASIVKEGVGTFRLRSLGIEADDDDFCVVLGGELTLSADTGIHFPTVAFENFRISTSGEVKIPGGWITFPEPVGVDLGGFAMELTAIGFGSTEAGLRWVGFSGGVSLTAGLPAGVSVDGLRVTWDPSGDTPASVSMEGIGVSLTVPGAFSFSGAVAYSNEGGVTSFGGAISLTIDALEFSIDGNLLVGRDTTSGDEPFNFLYLTLDVQLPVGIPLGATGAAIYGFGGAIGVNVSPSKRLETDTWYDWYTKADEDGHYPYDLRAFTKWGPEQDGFALGASMMVGTLPDAAYTLSGKGTLLVLLPGPVVMLQGLANLLSVPVDPSDNTSEGVFSLLAVLDANDGYFQLNVDAGYTVSKLIDISAAAEAFFDFTNPSAWHLYVGQDDPEDLRVRADVISLFHASSYLMIDADSLRSGFSVDFGDTWEYGIVSVTLHGWVASDFELTWRPAQLEGNVGLGGEIAVAVAGFSAGLSLEANLSGSAPKIYWIHGTASISIDLPAPLKDLDASIEFDWKQDLPPEPESPIQTISLEHEVVTGSWPVTIRTAADAFTPDADDETDDVPVVPLDIRPVIVFSHAMKSDFGNPPAGAEGEEIGEYSFLYELTGLELCRWSRAHAASGSGWVDVSDTLTGTWAADDAASDASRRLQLFAVNPFAFCRGTSRTYTDRYLANQSSWPCGEEPSLETETVDWENDTVGDTVSDYYTRSLVSFLDAGGTVVSYALSASATSHAVELDLPASGSFWIGTGETASRVEIWLAIANGADVTVRAFYGADQVGSDIVLHAPFAGLVELVGAEIAWVSFSWPDDTQIRLARVRWTKAESQFALDKWQARQERIEESLAEWESEGNLLQPESWYRLKVTAQTTRSHDGVADAPVEYENWIFFRTCGPPGVNPDDVVPSWVGETAWPATGAPADLEPYVQEEVPVHGSVAVYYGYDIGVAFNQDYVEQMYGGELVVTVRDPNGNALVDANGDALEMANLWGRTATASLRTSEISYLSRATGCTGASESAIPGETNFRTQAPGLLDTDFSEGIDDWTSSQEGPDGSMNWAVESGALVQSGDANDGDTTVEGLEKLGTTLSIGTTDWTDVLVEVSLQATTAAVGVVFRQVDADNFYRLSFSRSPNVRRLVRVSAGSYSELWSDTTAYTADTAMRVAIRCEGGRIRCQVDETLVCDVEDTSPITEGGIGLYSWGASDARFTRVVVADLAYCPLAPSTMYTAELAGRLLLYSDDFSGASPGAWLRQYPSSSSGTAVWSHSTSSGMDGGPALVQTGPVASAAGWGDGAWAEVGRAADWGDLEASCQIYGGDGGHVALLFCIQDDEHYYLADFDLGTGTVTLLSRSESTYTPLGSITSDAVTTAAWFEAGVSVEGGTVGVTVGGASVLSVPDTTYAAGRVGLGCSGESDARFSDVLVWRLPAVAVYTWTFTTGAYRDWVAHADSFGGVYEETLDASPTGLTDAVTELTDSRTEADALLVSTRADLAAADALDYATALAAVETARTERTAGANTAWTTLSTLLGLGYRPVPPVLEITALSDPAAGRVALLLESAEPLDFDRLELTLQELSGTSYVAVSTAVYTWSADGTRVLLFYAAGGEFADGTYRLVTVYRPEVGSEDAGRSHCGSDLAEVAHLDFELTTAA